MRKESYITPEATVIVNMAALPTLLLQMHSADGTADNWNQPGNYYEEVPAEDY